MRRESARPQADVHSARAGRCHCGEAQRVTHRGQDGREQRDFQTCAKMPRLDTSKTGT